MIFLKPKADEIDVAKIVAAAMEIGSDLAEPAGGRVAGDAGLGKRPLKRLGA